MGCAEKKFNLTMISESFCSFLYVWMRFNNNTVAVKCILVWDAIGGGICDDFDPEIANTTYKIQNYLETYLREDSYSEILAAMYFFYIGIFENIGQTLFSLHFFWNYLSSNIFRARFVFCFFLNLVQWSMLETNISGKVLLTSSNDFPLHFHL